MKPKRVSPRKAAGKTRPKAFRQQNPSLPAAQLSDRFSAESDGHTLRNAAEIRANPMRHRAAMAHMKQQHSILSQALGHEPSDEAGMRRYAKRRRQD